MIIAATPRLPEAKLYGYYAKLYTSKHGLYGLDGSSWSTQIADFHHADINLRNDRATMAVANLVVGHPTATDFEHSTAQLARIELAGFTLVRMYGVELVFQAAITGFRSYAPGAEFLSASDIDTTAGMCDDGYYGPEHEPHPFMAYLPEQTAEHAALVGQLVRIELIPEALVDAQGNFIEQQ